MTELHVIPDHRAATWRLYDTEATAPLSQHTSATDAEFAARTVAEDRGAERIVVHDRYHRTRDAGQSCASPDARADA